MKIFLLLILLALSTSLPAQDGIPGRYRDYFGSRLYLHADSTFEYTRNLHLSSSWTKGRWKLTNKVICLEMIPIWDTLTVAEPGKLPTDSLVLSEDDMPERISLSEHTGMLLSSGGQNRFPYPRKLLWKKGRLYKIENGKVIYRKQKGFSTKKKWATWYFKSDD